jgi:hypothetical protein
VATHNSAALQIDLDHPISLMLAWMLPVDLDFKQMLLGCRSDAERTTKLLSFYKCGAAQAAARGADLAGGGAQWPCDVAFC